MIKLQTVLTYQIHYQEPRNTSSSIEQGSTYNKLLTEISRF